MAVPSSGIGFMDIVPLFSYLLVMSITPGPNNIMVTASGVNFGFRRTIPHMTGICTGNAVQFLLCVLLLSGAAGWLAAVRTPLAVVGCAYLIWLSWKLARASAPGSARVLKPVSFFEAMLFQYANPKAWVMVLNTIILFLPTHGRLPAAMHIALLGIVAGLPSVALWTWGGDTLRRWLHRSWALQAFNLAMAGLLAATALWLLFDELSA